jgi:hypothetical protein
MGETPSQQWSPACATLETSSLHLIEGNVIWFKVFPQSDAAAVDDDATVINGAPCEAPAEFPTAAEIRAASAERPDDSQIAEKIKSRQLAVLEHYVVAARMTH